MLNKIFIYLRNQFLNFFGHLKYSKYPPFLYYKPIGYKVRVEQVRELISKIKPGDLLVRGYDDFVNGLFIGYWSHIGLVLDSQNVIHAIGKGLTKEDLFNFFRCDRILVLRPNLTTAEIKKVLSYAKTQEGKPYDFGFNSSNADELYCSEFTYNCFEQYKEQLSMKKKQKSILGFFKKEVVLPGDFVEFEGFKEIYTYLGEK